MIKKKNSFGDLPTIYPELAFTKSVESPSSTSPTNKKGARGANGSRCDNDVVVSSAESTETNHEDAADTMLKCAGKWCRGSATFACATCATLLCSKHSSNEHEGHSLVQLDSPDAAPAIAKVCSSLLASPY